ncbi:hypothetical protein [Chryseolinea lacunae]|uniref:Auto-transporter adhesin head GIN domain-containing protein n=1 Tax=Chryseolinea lacunae TaxID=2801331 RepID=A0ABS1KZ12_9BACT|nr:hypothetical protein [Chryseolinea lacunae]MBL0744418.1 hypothetical protein [Chryseolinea lacunae]
MNPISPQDFLQLMMTGGVIENMSVTGNVEAMMQNFQNPVIILNCEIPMLALNESPVQSLTIAGTLTQIPSLVLVGQNTNFSLLCIEDDASIGSLSLSGMGQSTTLTVDGNVNSVSLNDCSIQTVEVVATNQINTVSLTSVVFINSLRLIGPYQTVTAGFSSCNTLIFEDTTVTTININSSPIVNYQFTNHQGGTLSFDSTSFKQSRSLAFNETSFETITVNGDQNRTFANLAVTLTGQ